VARGDQVDAGFSGNVELAMVKRMIELIRTHYRRLQLGSHRRRVVTIGAPEDSGGRRIS
jgi:hypothetical protein